MLDVVRQRVGAIRRARRARFSAGCVVTVLLTATVLARAGDDPSSELRVVGPASTASTTVLTTSTSVVTTPVADETTTTTTVPTTRVQTTVPLTTVGAIPPTTTPAPPTTAPSTTTTLADVRAACDSSEVVVTATPDRDIYTQGSPVTVTATALNRGLRVCLPHDPKLEFFNPAGAGVGGVAIADAFTMGRPGEPPPTWDPGETLSIPFKWPQLCGGPCPSGQYTVIATFGTFRSAPASFIIN